MRRPPLLPMRQSERRSRILVVDDEPDVRLLCRLVLEAEGHEVVESATGREALQLATEAEPDLVVLDVMLPDLDGWHVLAALRENPATAELPVVMLTAKAHQRSQLYGWQAGASDYETKRLRKDGSRVYVSISLSPLFDDTGEVTGCAVVVRDMSDRERADARFR